MKFMLLMLPTVPGTLEDRRRLRPIGRNNERYQQMLEEVRKLVVFADEVGFDVFATTEHHFHSEGYETSVAPLMLYTDLAARTKRIKFSPLGLVLPGWDPIRAAEELAILDHLTKGRVYAGFARGYQDRWVNVLGQQYHVTGAPMDGSSIDNHNRRVYEETLKVIKKAWTEDSWEYNGEYYKVPYPYEEGIRRWPVAEWTRTYGAPGEIDDEGVIRKISVVPKPYQQPHPPMFQPFSVSESTIRYTAQSGIVPWILVANPPDFQRLCHVYKDEAATAGRQLRLGENVGAFRAVHFRTTEDAAKYPLDPYTPLPPSEWTVDRMRKVKYGLAGTADQIKKEIESLRTIGGGGDLEWFGWFFDQGFMPWEEEVRQIELFAKHIIPTFR